MNTTHLEQPYRERVESVIVQWQPPVEPALERAPVFSPTRNNDLKSPRYKLLGSAEIDSLPPLEWRIKGVLPAKGVAAMYGPSGSGKSFLGFDMATAIAEGLPWFKRRVVPTSVVYVCLEGEAGVKQRLMAWEQANNRDMPERLHMILQPFKFTEDTDVSDLAAVVPLGGVVFIDTMNRAAPTEDENSSRDMGRILEAAKNLQRLTQGLVVLIHHTGKNPSQGMRGHSSLFAAMDATIEVSRNGDKRQWKIDKAKDGADGATHSFELKQVELGADADGEPVTSCVVMPDDSLVGSQRVKLPNCGNPKIALDALRPLFNDGELGKDGAPTDRPSIDRQAAVDVVANHLVVKPKRKRERAKQVITGLVTKGVLGQNDWRLWYAA